MLLPEVLERFEIVCVEAVGESSPCVLLRLLTGKAMDSELELLRL
jgi:hypothetical protein